MNRRTFLELSMGAGLAPSDSSPHIAEPNPAQPVSVENRFFRVVADPGKGTFSAWWRKKQLLLNAHGAAAGDTTFDLSDSLYSRTAFTRRINDKIGAGQQLVLAADTKKEAELELRLTLYDDLDALFAEIAVHNRSSKPLSLSSLEPARAKMDELGALLWSADRILTNGYIYSGHRWH
jgi:hypothetical protein